MRDIGDVRNELQDILAEPDTAAIPLEATKPGTRLPWVAAAVFSILAGAVV